MMDADSPKRAATFAGDLAARAAAVVLAHRHRPRRGHRRPGFRDRRYALGPGRHPVRRLAHGLRPRAGSHLADAPPAVPLARPVGRGDLPGDRRRDLRRPARCRRRPPERRDDVRGAPAGDRGPCARTGRTARDVTRPQPAGPDRSCGRDRRPGDGKRGGHRRRRRGGRAERVRGHCRALHRRGDLGGDGRRRGDPARLAPAIPARALLRGHRCPRASHRPFVWWVHPRPGPDRADLRWPHLDRGLPPGYPLRAAHRGHRGAPPVHPLHRAAVRMGRSCRVRAGPGARGRGSGAGHQPADRCRHAADRDPHGDGPGGQDQRGRGPGRRHARGGDRRGHGRDLRDPDRRRDPGHHRLPAQAGRPVAPRDRRTH